MGILAEVLRASLIQFPIKIGECIVNTLFWAISLISGFATFILSAFQELLASISKDWFSDSGPDKRMLIDLSPCRDFLRSVITFFYHFYSSVLNMVSCGLHLMMSSMEHAILWIGGMITYISDLIISALYPFGKSMITYLDVVEYLPFGRNVSIYACFLLMIYMCFLPKSVNTFIAKLLHKIKHKFGHLMPFNVASEASPSHPLRREVEKLEAELVTLERKLRESESATTCVICLKNKREIVLINCWHCCLCRECLQGIIVTGQCPLCRQDIFSYAQVYI